MTVKFERQHFNAIAKILGECVPLDETFPTFGSMTGAQQEWINITHRFADYLKQGNELFDASIFRDYVETHARRTLAQERTGELDSGNP